MDRSTSLTRTFDRIYRQNRWRGRESLSGPGSGLVATQHVSRWVREMVTGLGARSVLSVGCGDDLWMPDLPGYLGVDVSLEAIRRARRLHPDRRYLVGDATTGLPAGPWDVVIVRDVIQHLPLASGLRLLDVIREAGVGHLIGSTYVGVSERYSADLVNVDIRAGECYSPDLTREPFDLPDPAVWTFDGWDYDDSSRLADASKLLGLWGLRQP